MEGFIQWLNKLVWGAPALVLILGVGAYLAARTHLVQLRLLPQALVAFSRQLKRREDSENSPFRAVCTALAATVGTGNLAGVAGAIALGGPGSIFWMWLCGILGMGLKFAEATLAVRFRRKNSAGEYVGGPMYMLSAALPRRWGWLGGLYAFFGVVAAFGVGNATQINTVVVSTRQMLLRFQLPAPPWLNLVLGLTLGALVGAMLLGGAKRIGAAAEWLVPIAAGTYLLLGLGVLIAHSERIPLAFAQILEGAWSPRAVTGGLVGSAFQALRIGVSRGVFTNEAGMGTASIAHAGASVRHPVEQGLMGIVEVFIDTLVICTMTALVILCSGVPIPYGTDPGAALTEQAFSAVYGPWCSIYLTAALCCFALATVLGWGLYGVRCAQYLLGDNAWKPFALLQTGVVVLGAVLESQTVWAAAEAVNGLMALPNLIALAVLTPELCRLLKEYDKNIRHKKPVEVHYENFHQRQSLRAVPHAEVPPLCGGSREAGHQNLPSEHRPA